VLTVGAIWISCAGAERYGDREQGMETRKKYRINEVAREDEIHEEVKMKVMKGQYVLFEVLALTTMTL
jgi:hypothetical protein